MKMIKIICKLKNCWKINKLILIMIELIIQKFIKKFDERWKKIWN